VEVIDTPGHTVGHVSFHLPRSALAFTADTLMAMGCGRLFEGTAAQMWDSLLRLRALPPDTTVCSGTNTPLERPLRAFHRRRQRRPSGRAEAIRQTRERGEPTVPSNLGEEIATNPFLRADDPVLKSAMGMPDASDAEVFGAIRSAKDGFR
jgi:hydroxyacylglutathione hydrolase